MNKFVIVIIVLLVSLNVSAQEKDINIVPINISKELGKSKTEKTIIVANSHGEWSIKGTDLRIGMFAFKYPKKKTVKEKPEEMQNINVKLDKNNVILKIDTRKNYGPSSTGKSIIVASTRGNKIIKNTGVYLGLNVYKLKKK